MEDKRRQNGSLDRTLTDGVHDMDLLDQFLSSDGWAELPNASNYSLPGFPGSSVISANKVQPAEWNSTSSIASPQRTSWWIQGSSYTSSLKDRFMQDRFMQALDYIKETQMNADVLVQLWVPERRQNQLMLVTSDQPFALDSNCDKLVHYRQISTKYQFSAEENSNTLLGLPGRVFVGRLPEWTPDVRYFSTNEYPRVDYAQKLDVHGSIALPIFERGNCSCLGVVEVIMTFPKTNFSFELNTICSALQAVNLRTSEVSRIPPAKLNSSSFETALREIREVASSTCSKHTLPLAQTWVSCAQQGKRGNRHTDENYKLCVSTVDIACFVNDSTKQGFHEACSNHHLFRGQGVVGNAFMTNQSCFLPDVSSFSNSDYPLSHYARMFGLKGAVAIRLRCMRTGGIDFVLEFFLPASCIAHEDQVTMLNSLSITLQDVCQTLRTVTDQEIVEEMALEMEAGSSSSRTAFNNSAHAIDGVNDVCLETSMVEPFGEKLSENVSMPEAGTNKTLKGSTDKSDQLEKGFSCERFSEVKHDPQDSIEKNNESVLGNQIEVKEKTGRMKIEKTVSKEVLQKYFAGSLKDAAKSLGVCPTTLKRICREHGITRWPSRKLKKVDHSLKKLQRIVDSVEGVGKEFQLHSIYKQLTKTSTSGSSLPGSRSLKTIASNDDVSEQRPMQQHLLGHHISSFSRSLSADSIKMDEHPLAAGAPTTLRECREQFPLTRQNEAEWMRVKATFGAEKVRLRFNPSWSFEDLKREISTRFSIGHTRSLNLKYLDDDYEWVLLTCNEDLQECIQVYKSSNDHTVKVSAHVVGSDARTF